MWHNLSQETPQNPRDAIDSYFQWDAKPACEWEARRRIVNEFDSRLDAYKDPFAIEEVAMGDMLAMPVIIVLAMNATKLC